MEKKKRTVLMIIPICILLLLLIIGLLFWQYQKKSKEDKTAITAMYLTYGEGESIFVDSSNGTAFTAHIPEEIYDINGKKITRDGLSTGNVVKIYGNGIMLSSYPGQYPGVTKMKVIQEGTPADGDQYQDLIDQLYQEPDPAQPPTLDGAYTTSLAKVSAVITRGGYQWTYTDKDGNTQSVTTDSAHVLEWKDISDLTLEKATDIKLNFSQTPKNVTAVRWPVEKQRTQSGGGEIPDGESVEISQAEGEWMLTKAEPGYIYLVTGTWDNGSVEFGFLTK